MTLPMCSLPCSIPIVAGVDRLFLINVSTSVAILQKIEAKNVIHSQNPSFIDQENLSVQYIPP